MTEDAAAPQLLKAECSQCGGMRNCDVRGAHEVRYEDEHTWGRTTWRILQCRGCEHVFVQTNSIFSEDYEPTELEDGSTNETLKYWPALSKRKMPEWMSSSGITVGNIGGLDPVLLELYTALDNDLHMLAGSGIRTAFDVASDLLGIDQGLTFGEKLDELVTMKLIGAVDKDRMAVLVDAGSAALHRGWRPTAEDLDAVMAVLEHFIFEAFVAPDRRRKLDEGAAKVKTKVPPRKKRGESKPT